MYGAEERLEWVRDLAGDWTLAQLMNLNGLDWDELFGIDDYDEFEAYLSKFI